MTKPTEPEWFVCRACGFQVRAAARLEHHTRRHPNIPKDLPWQPLEERDAPRVPLSTREVRGGLLHGPIGGEVHIHEKKEQ